MHRPSNPALALRPPSPGVARPPRSHPPFLAVHNDGPCHRSSFAYKRSNRALIL
ncbi:hypothetical protein BGY98DRAFT_964577 [Russula aff. rugulosa BPL654]|nr:hypothetical protein BGY98DRAFT_964577 [Russula aff. rugulosa BPL654]